MNDSEALRPVGNPTFLYLVPIAELNRAGHSAAYPAGRFHHVAWRLLLVGLVAVAAYGFAVNTADWSVLTLCLATLVMFLGAVPLLIYLRRGQFRTIPFFEGHCLFYSICFGYAGFRPLHGMETLIYVPEYYLQLGLFAALGCLLMLYIGFYGIGADAFARIRPFSMSMPDSRAITPRFLASEMIVWIILEFCQRMGAPGFHQVTEIMRSFVFVHFIVCQYLGLLPRWMRLFFWVGFVPWMVLVGSDLVNGRIFGLIMFAIWISMALFWARGRISVGWFIFAAVMIVLFQPVKVVYRMDIWERSGEYTTMHKINLFFDTLMKQTSQLKTGVDQQNAFEDAFSRLNHLMLTACVIRDTPAHQPFQYGKTYLPLITKWIPRIFWPAKPVEDLGNRWGRQWGYLDPADFATSLNLPWLTEMFINFGWFGVFIIPLLLGILFRWLWYRLARAPASSVDFSLGAALLSREILVESHLSMVLGGLIVGFASLFLILVVIRATFGGRA